MKRIFIAAPHTGKPIPYVDMRNPVVMDCPSKAVGFQTHAHGHPAFINYRVEPPKPDQVTKIGVDPLSYLVAIDTVETARHITRGQVTDLCTTAMASAVEQEHEPIIEDLLSRCLEEDFNIPEEIRVVIGDAAIRAIWDYSKALRGYYTYEPLFTIQPRVPGDNGLDFGLFYSIPGLSPIEITIFEM